MKAEYLNPFVKSIISIIESTVGEAPQKGDIFLRKHYPFHAENIVILLGVTGQLKGQVALSMPIGCAKKIAAVMMMEEEISELDEYAQSALAELLNMIAANATIGLEEAGYVSDITPPAVVIGREIEISCAGDTPTIVIPMALSYGEIEANLSLVDVRK